MLVYHQAHRQAGLGFGYKQVGKALPYTVGLELEHFYMYGFFRIAQGCLGFGYNFIAVYQELYKVAAGMGRLRYGIYIFGQACPVPRDGGFAVFPDPLYYVFIPAYGIFQLVFAYAVIHIVKVRGVFGRVENAQDSVFHIFLVPVGAV